MSSLRDLLIAPPRADGAVRDPRPAAGSSRGGLRALWRPRVTGAALPATAASLGLLAPERELPAAAAAAGLALVRRAPTALVCLRAPAIPGRRAPARAAAARLAASMVARDLVAEARGRLALVALPEDARECAAAAARALAAAGPAPTVLAVAARDDDIDVLLAARDAILVALAPSADPALATLALSGATELAPAAAALSLTLDPLARALALAGVRAPRAIRDAVEAVVG